MILLKIVIKIGGSILTDGVNNTLITDIKALTKSENIIIVHGGGKTVTNIAEQMGKEQKFIISPSGVRSRYTDKETVEIFTMVMSGKINKEITKTLQKFDVNAVGISGIDGKLISATRKKKLIIKAKDNRKKIIEGGYTGKIIEINNQLLDIILTNNYTPVISPIALSEEYDLLNVDGDRAAAYIGGGIKADKVIFLTDVRGVLENGKVIKKLNLSEAKELKKTVGHGMEKKLLASIESLEMGVKEVIISSGDIRNPISSILKENEGTVITND